MVAVAGQFKIRELHLDFEGRSRAPLGGKASVGAARYAVDPTTRILMCGIALGDEEPRLWVNPEFETETLRSHPRVWEWLDLLIDPTVLIYAHNSPFETAVTRERMMLDMGIVPPELSRWRCTMAMARRAALPQALDELGTALGLAQQKDKRGVQLINLFCKPRTAGKLKGQFIEPRDRPDEWREFGAYCLQDVRTERDAHKKLKAFGLKGEQLRTFILDGVLNDRGVPVNVVALKNAQRIIDECVERLGSEFHQITGLSHTQRAKVQAWLQERGYPYEDMQGPTLDEAILYAPTWASEETTRALELKRDLSYAATSKITTMLKCVCPDGRLRGMLLFYGAGPGRWASKILNIQNFKRPTIKDTQFAYKMICEGCDAETLSLIFGNPLEVISSCIRHFIHLPGAEMFDADYSAVEARIVNWLADQKNILDRYRKYDETGSKEFDGYVRMAETIFGKNWSFINSDERWLGKQTELGCGFQMGPDKFFNQITEKAKQFGIKGIVITEDLAARAIDAYREDHDLVKELWWECDGAARRAILNPGRLFRAGKYLSFVVVVSEGIPYLAMRLPSGRSIVYPFPKLEPDADRPGKMAITFWGKHPKKNIWTRLRIYGGMFLENATQGTAADFMGHGAANAVDRGFDVFMLVHDQALAHVRPGQRVEDFCAALTDLPPWAAGCPVKAEGKVVPYYLKL